MSNGVQVHAQAIGAGLFTVGADYSMNNEQTASARTQKVFIVT